MSENRIGLYGVGGLYNYGCEAIVRGTTELVRRVAPEASITYFTPRADDDRRQVADLRIDVVQMPAAKRSLPLKVLGKASRILAVPFDATGESYETVLDDCDILVSIGGDIYTIPEHVRRKGRYPYFNRLVRLGQLANARGVREVIMGASIGPFGSFRRAVDYYADHLKTCAAIFCRERVTLEYLDSIGVSYNTVLMPDPAFFVKNPAGLPRYEDARYLGVNLSPLSLRELQGRVSEDAVERLARQVEALMDETGLPALFVPHVFAPSAEDNDESFLRLVFERLDVGHRKRCEIVAPKGFIDAKRYLAQCQLVVAARMHCAVNAICVGVPTVFLSYSKKSIGMCELVYGSRGWAVPLVGTDSLKKAAMSLYAERETVHSRLEKRVEELKGCAQNENAFAELARALG